jgi:ferredoxin--NADP+ reductase
VVVFQILEARSLAPQVRRFRVSAPRVARFWRAGQFVIVRASTDGERIPLTIADGNADEGWIDLIIQGVGKTTLTINGFGAGDALADIAGPLGTPSRIELFGTVVTIGGGVGSAIVYPIARALLHAGNRVLAIVGGRSKDYVLLEEELREICNRVYPTTDDGSYGRQGLVTDVLRELIDGPEKIDRVLAVGPIPMMRAVSEMTRPSRIETVVSLNPIMVDGTGMCGGCRVLVEGVTKFACVDGPEFDAHLVNFEVLAARNTAYEGYELARVAGSSWSPL